MFTGSGPGPRVPHGCSVEMYRRPPYLGELEAVRDRLPPRVRVLELGCGTERDNAGKGLGDFWEQIQAYAIATVLSATAGLDAFANELFVDHESIFPDLRFDLMSKLWELYEQKATLEKYELAVLLAQGVPLDRGASPYQDVAALIKLRNALTHYKPEWSTEQVEHAKVSTALQVPFLRQRRTFSQARRRASRAIRRSRRLQGVHS